MSVAAILLRLLQCSHSLCVDSVFDIFFFWYVFDKLGGRYFTWDKHFFPDPIAMQENLAASGRKLVTIIDPHIKKDSNYYIYKEGQEKGLFVMNKDKQEFDG